MEMLLVVDGGDVCRAPIVEYTLQKQFAGAGWLGQVEVRSRGLDVQVDRTMCAVAAGRIGSTTRALAFAREHQAEPLVAKAAERADLVLTAERTQRATVARLAPTARANAFTLKEALVLASVLSDEVRAGTMPRPASLQELAALLHDVRGSIPLIEPPMRTSVFHRDRALPEADPLTLVDGHDDQGLHRHATDETYQVALTAGARLVDLAEERLPHVGERPNEWWWRQHA